MTISYFTEDVKLPSKFPKRKLSKWIKEIAENHQKEIESIVYVFCTEEKILEINRQYLNHNFYTDIITFDYTKRHIINGEMYISLETVRSNSIMYQTKFAEELYRVMIHGVLHLCGLKDNSVRLQKKMSWEEDIALKVLRTYIDF